MIGFRASARGKVGRLSQFDDSSAAVLATTGRASTWARGPARWCKGCGRRGAIGEEDSKRQMHQGNMDELDDAQFKCMRRGTAVRAYIPTHKTRLDTAP